MFQKTVQDPHHPDIFSDFFRQGVGVQPADTAHDQIDLHMPLCRRIKMLDHLVVNDRIHLDRDMPRVLMAGKHGFPVDQVDDPVFQLKGGNNEFVPVRRIGETGNDVEQSGNIRRQQGIVAEIAQVRVLPCGLIVVIPGAEMHITADPGLFPAHDQQRLAMDFQPGDAIHHMSACLRQFPGAADVVFFIESRLDLKEDRDLFAVPGSFHQRIHDGRVAADTIQSLLDRQHIRIFRRFFQQTHHRVKGFVGMVDHQGAAAPDIFDHAQIGIDPQGRQRRHGVVGQFRHLQACQFPEIFQVQGAVDGISLFFRSAQFFLQERAGLGGGGLCHFQPDHDPFRLALKRDLHFRKQVVNRLFINGKVHIP